MERREYLDEADRFYLKSESSSSSDPDSKEEEDGGGDGLYGVRFLREEMWGGGDALSSISHSHSHSGSPNSSGNGSGQEKKKGPEEIPRYIVGFEGIEEVLKKFFEEDERGRELGVELKKVWSGWNGAFNEDWRRKGRLVVWDTGVYEPVEEVKRNVFA